MRAITGTIVSSEPCPLRKACTALRRFTKSAASDLPSSDCAAYLLAVRDAITDHLLFRRSLGLEEGKRNRQDREGRGGVAPHAGGPRHDSAAQAELEAAAGEKKSKKSRCEKEDPSEDEPVAGVAPLGPASPEIAGEKKRKKKAKHSEEGQEAVALKQEADLVPQGEIGTAKKKNKKKKDKDHHVKLEEVAMDVDEVDRRIAVAEQSGAGGEKRRKKKKHEEADGKEKDVKEETVADVDLDSEKKRKGKRGRGDNDDNALELVEHTKKKQRKQP